MNLPSSMHLVLKREGKIWGSKLWIFSLKIHRGWLCKSTDLHCCQPEQRSFLLQWVEFNAETARFAESKWLEVLNHRWGVCMQQLLPGSGHITDEEEYCYVLWHDMAAVHTNSEELNLPAQDHHMIEAVENSSIESGPSPHSLLRSYWQSMAAGG